MTLHASLEYSWSLQQPSSATFGFYWGFQPLQKLHKRSCLCLPDGVIALGKRISTIRGNLTPTLFLNSLNYWNHFILQWWGIGEKTILLHVPICKMLAMMLWKRRKKMYFMGERKAAIKRKEGEEEKWRKNTL